MLLAQGKRRSRYAGLEHFGLPVEDVIVPPAARSVDKALRPENDPVLLSALSPEELAEISRLREIARNARSRNHRRHNQIANDRVLADELRTKTEEVRREQVGRRVRRRGARATTHIPMNAEEFEALSRASGVLGVPSESSKQAANVANGVDLRSQESVVVVDERSGEVSDSGVSVTSESVTSGQVTAAPVTEDAPVVKNTAGADSVGDSDGATLVENVIKDEGGSHLFSNSVGSNPHPSSVLPWARERGGSRRGR